MVPSIRLRMWWAENYGVGSESNSMSKEDKNVLYRALRDGNLAKVKAFVSRFPHCIVTKIFGNNEVLKIEWYKLRTARLTMS